MLVKRIDFLKKKKAQMNWTSKNDFSSLQYFTSKVKTSPLLLCYIKFLSSTTRLHVFLSVMWHFFFLLGYMTFFFFLSICNVTFFFLPPGYITFFSAIYICFTGIAYHFFQILKKVLKYCIWISKIRWHLLFRLLKCNYRISLYSRQYKRPSRVFRCHI